MPFTAPNLTLGGVLGLLVLAILFGYLVPLRTVVREQRILEAQIQHLREANATKDAQLAELLASVSRPLADRERVGEPP